MDPILLLVQQRLSNNIFMVCSGLTNVYCVWGCGSLQQFTISKERSIFLTLFVYFVKILQLRKLTSASPACNYVTTDYMFLKGLPLFRRKVRKNWDCRSVCCWAWESLCWALSVLLRAALNLRRKKQNARGSGFFIFLGGGILVCWRLDKWDHAVGFFFFPHKNSFFCGQKRLFHTKQQKSAYKTASLFFSASEGSTNLCKDLDPGTLDIFTINPCINLVCLSKRWLIKSENYRVHLRGKKLAGSGW